MPRDISATVPTMKPCFIFLVTIGVVTLTAFGEELKLPGKIELIAGGGTAVEGKPAAECKLSQPFGITTA